jgi:prephenate dehydrogenase
MDEDGFTRLAQARVAIIGLGLMGGSLALALRGKCASLLGIDRDPHTLALAQREGIVDQAASEPAELLPQATVIVLATPVNTILGLLRELPAWHPGPATVLDLGSTKHHICQAMQALPERFDPLGGHPMCGREKNGLPNASRDLFHGAPFVLAALERTSSQAKALGAALAQAVGARPLWLDPETHDRWAAATSHLPYLAASALMLGTPPEASPLFGPGFHSTTRVAATSPTIMLDILKTNQAEVLAALGRFRLQLGQLEADLRGGNWDSLQAHLSEAAERRASLELPFASQAA